jgi:hypothetical protein
MQFKSYDTNERPIPRGYFMRHKTGCDVGFSWNKDDPQFSDDWERIPAVPEQTPAMATSEGDDSQKGFSQPQSGYDQPLRDALQKTLEGLAALTPRDPSTAEQKSDTSYAHLHWMIAMCLENLDSWPTDKISRWVGFVQGVQTLRGDMSSQDERDRTRPFFHEAYESMGLSAPATVERTDATVDYMRLEDFPNPQVIESVDPWDYSGLHTKLRPELVGRWMTIPLMMGDGSMIVTQLGGNMLVQFSDYKVAQQLTSLHNAAIDQAVANTAKESPSD